MHNLRAIQTGIRVRIGAEDKSDPAIYGIMRETFERWGHLFQGLGRNM